VSKELDVSYNVCKLEPKFISHQFPGFLNGLPTHVPAAVSAFVVVCAGFLIAAKTLLWNLELSELGIADKVDFS